MMKIVYFHYASMQFKFIIIRSFLIIRAQCYVDVLFAICFQIASHILDYSNDFGTNIFCLLI